MKSLIFSFLLFSAVSYGQTFHTLKVGNSSPIDPSAILEVQGTTGALLCPRMTTSQKNAIAATNGDIVYDSTLSNFYGYVGGAWISLGNPSPGSAIWGNITGTLSNQTDLQTALNGKEPSITAGTIYQYWRGDKTFQTLNAPAVAYTPTTSGNWSPVPTTTQGALDTLAAAIVSAATPATRTVTTSTSISSSDRYVNVNATGATTISLPSASTAGQVYTVSNRNTGISTVTPNGGDTINGLSSFSLRKGDSLSIFSSGGVWTIW